MSLNNILKREIGRLLQHKVMCAGCECTHKKWDSAHWNLDKVGPYFFEVDVIYGFLESVDAESFCDNLKDVPIKEWEDALKKDSYESGIGRLIVGFPHDDVSANLHCLNCDHDGTVVFYDGVE